MLDALVAGTTDAAILAELAKGRLRAKLPELREALEGRFDAQHALIVGAILAKLDFLDEQITLLGDAIEEQLAPFADAVRLLCTIPGVQARTAQVIIAEVGPDMSVFPTDRHLASWAAQCPGNDQSAGKRRSGKTGKGSRWLGIALTEAALARLIRKTPTSRRSTGACAAGAATKRRSAPSNTRSPSRLAHAHDRRAVRRSRDGLLRPPSRPAAQDQAPDRPARKPRTNRRRRTVRRLNPGGFPIRPTGPD